MNSEYQTFLKIIPWETFWGICPMRIPYENVKICSQSPTDEPIICESSCKKTMLACPLWSQLRNFYGNKTWHKIKEKEDIHGRFDKTERQQIAKESKKYRPIKSPIRGRFRTEAI